MSNRTLRVTVDNQEPFLSGKVAIVNGASSEIGRAINTTLLEHGAIIAGTYNKNKGQIDNLIELYGDKRVLGFRIDFLSEEWQSNIEKIVTQTKAKFGKIDILINVSGVWLVKPFLYERKEEIEEIWCVNYWAPYHFMKKTLSQMMQNGGHIINIASTSGIRGTGQEATYSASKAALLNLTQSLAEEFAPRGIKINAISPGLTDTPALSKYFDESMKELLSKRIPIGKLCSPADIANATLSILMNNYMVGMNIILHGGKL